MPTLIPISLAEARAFIAEHHSHNLPPQGWRFGVGAAVDGRLVGVATAGRPVARHLDDGVTVEVTRCCTDGTPMVASMLYGAVTRAAKALGYRRAITYTLAEEPASCVKAAGFVEVGTVAARPSWSTPSRPRHQTDLFDRPRRPAGPKVRWERTLAT